MQYRGPTSKHGIRADLYTPPEDVFNSSSSDHQCFHSGSDKCVPQGLQYIGPCQSGI